MSFFIQIQFLKTILFVFLKFDLRACFKPKSFCYSKEKSLKHIPYDRFQKNLVFETQSSTIQFFSVEQCSKALKANGYEVRDAVNFLKVEKLLEMGLCTDRSAAIRALTANDWDVNNAAIQLVS